jgi:hypothetical protein
MPQPPRISESGAVARRDTSEAPALDALHEPELPERLSAVELLGHDAPRQPLQPALVSGRGQGHVAHVVGQVELVVVDPDGMLEPRDGGEEPVDVEPLAVPDQGGRLEDRHRPDVHVGVGILDLQEGGVEGGEPFVVGIGHRLEVAPESSTALARSIPPWGALSGAERPRGMA